MRIRRITIIRERVSPADNINDELQWLANSLGLFSERDRDSSCFRLFIELVKASKQERMLSSDELAYKLRLSRGTVIHHINKMMESGVVVSEKRRYTLRQGSLKRLVEIVEKDVEETMSNMKKVAEDIDKELGL